MTETGEMLATAAKRLFEESFTDAAVRDAANGLWQADVWAAVEAGGYPLALLSEEQGGFGLEQSEALNLIRLAASYASPIPLSETMLANHALTSSGFAAVEGPASIAPVLERETLQLRRENGLWRLNGVAHAVPWARHASHIVTYAEYAGDMFVMPLARADLVVNAGVNMAGQPRDTVEFNVALSDEVVRPITAPEARTRQLGRGAVVRALEMAGALDRVLKMTTDYANGRVQFGKPIGRFQAVQHLIAVLATQAAAAGAAADIAAASFQEASLLPVAVAKLRVGEAAGICASIAHQVHGAIGYTDEHRLNYFTKRLWSWRDEFGSETAWARYLGRCALAANADGFWPFVVDVFNPRSDSQP
jgi:acyl-CoA dehydrogenase